MHCSLKASLLGIVTLAAIGLVQSVSAQTTVYSNTTTFSGISLKGFAPANATGFPPVADDITPATGYSGSAVTQFTFGINNGDFGPLVVTTTASFYAPDGANGGPGTLLGSAPLGGLTLPGGFSTFTENSTTGFFTMPQGAFWAGLTFSGQPVSNLNNLALPIYTPPTVGSSQSTYFLGSGTASNPPASNPAGTISSLSGTTAPPVDFYWRFLVTPAPEPSQTAAFALGSLTLAGLALKARRRKVSTVSTAEKR